jgi:SAM-dependent methyltransferase
MNYQVVEETIRAGYREAFERYRRDDEVEVTTPNHRRIQAKLRKLCLSFDHPIRVLDVGCGTGRYFHCVSNATDLTGIDISEDMLHAAENPVLPQAITVSNIRLKRANVYVEEFPAGAFDMVYSLGVFGDGCGVTTELCNKFHDWLAPGGKLYFNNVDMAGVPLSYRARQHIRELIYPVLTSRQRAALDERRARRPFFALTRRGLETIVRQSRFKKFEIESHPCETPLGWGRHLECVAVK